MCNFINKDNFKVSNFYRFPKALMSKRYDSLSLESKVAYSFLLDMVSLSIENNWVNEEGNVFVKIKRKELMKKLGVKGTQKMVRIMEELKTFGLIAEEKMGFGRCNRIFLCDLESFENQISEDKNSNQDTFENQNSKILKSNFKSFVFQKHNKTNINKTKNIKTNINKTQSNQNLAKTFDFKNLKNNNPQVKTFEVQNSVDKVNNFVDEVDNLNDKGLEKENLNYKEYERQGLGSKEDNTKALSNKKYDYDIETLDTARELLGCCVDYKDANTLLNEACGNLYILDLAYEKMIGVKGKIKNIVGYLRTILISN